MTSIATIPSAPAKFSPDMLAASALILRKDEEPIAAWMRGSGFDPDDGWVLVLPSDFTPGVSLFPSYVLISTMIVNPMVMNTRAMALQP